MVEITAVNAHATDDDSIYNVECTTDVITGYDAEANPIYLVITEKYNSAMRASVLWDKLVASYLEWKDRDDREKTVEAFLSSLIP